MALVSKIKHGEYEKLRLLVEDKNTHHKERKLKATK